MALEATKANIEAYVKQKKWYWYSPLWLLGFYAFCVLVRLQPNDPVPLIILVPQTFDFFLHEMAHIVTGFLPAILTAAAGSLSEIMLGSMLVYLAIRTRSYFLVMTCCLWFMLACESAGVYMADARAQQLNLVSLGGALSGDGTALHDWHFVFGRLGILNLDTVIGGTVRGAGIVVGLFGVGFAAWLMYKMATSRGPVALPEKEAQLLREAGETNK